MPYEITATGVGPWVQGQTVSDAEWNAYPWRDKAIRKGYAVQAGETRALDPAAQAQEVGDLDAQIAQLQAQRAKVLGLNQEPTAPAQVAVEIQPDDQPNAQEIDATRAAGKEVVQPTDANVNMGEVVPGEAAEDTKPRSRERK
jgi:hypothetical protein